MKLRSYQSYSMAEALAAVKRDLGADAVILRTRSWKRGGFLGIGRRTVIEVVAAPAADVRRERTAPAPAPTSGSRSRRRSAPSLAAMRAYQAKPEVPATEDATSAAVVDDRARTKRLAQALLEQHERRRREEAAQARAEAPAAVAEKPAQDEPVTAVPPLAQATDEQINPARLDASAAVAVAIENDAAAGVEDMPVAVAEPAPVAPVATIEPIPETAAPEPATVQDAPGQPRRFVLRDPAAAPSAPATDRMPIEDELAAIRSMVGEVMRRQVTAPRGGTTVPTMPPALFDWYMRLISQDVSEELADRIVNDVRDELGPNELEDGVALRDAMRRHLADYIPVADSMFPRETEDGRPLTIALVGPTGVGKTTTLAKLAATFRLREGLRVGLVTADTYRIAAVEQLRTYANIIGVPLHVAQTAADMRDVIAQLDDVDIVLVDTAGRGQRDDSRLDELRGILDAADPHEVHLVLSSTAGEKVLLHEAEAFSRVGVDRVVLTKLDEAVSFGVLVNVARRIGKDLSYFTNGQEVPDHIEPSNANRLADLVLTGGEE